MYHAPCKTITSPYQAEGEVSDLLSCAENNLFTPNTHRGSLAQKVRCHSAKGRQAHQNSSLQVHNEKILFFKMFCKKKQIFLLAVPREEKEWDHHSICSTEKFILEFQQFKRGLQICDFEPVRSKVIKRKLPWFNRRKKTWSPMLSDLIQNKNETTILSQQP